MFDLYGQDGQLFIVMELLMGQDLAKEISGRALPVERAVERAVELAVQLADGLAVVHAANIVHRDLKPANIFIKSGGTLKICDFGIARDNDEANRHFDSVIGTPPYMAPERVLRDKRVESPSDLWAVGCILYEMLTGRHVFASGVTDPSELFRRIVSMDPEPPFVFNPRVSTDLGEAVMCLLAKDQSKRPTARQLKLDLEHLQRSFGAVTETITAQAPAYVTAPIAASSLGQGHIEVFVLATDRRLRHRWYWPDPSWSSWCEMPVPTGQAAVIAVGSKDNSHEEIAVAIGDTVHHRWWTGQDDGWSDWNAMPRLGSQVTDVAFSSNIADALEVYALDQRGRIHHRWWWRDAGWSDCWHPMETPGGQPVTAIAAGSYADHHQELFAIVDGEIWHRWWWRNDGWSAWHQQPPVGMRATDIAVSSMKEGHIEVFAIDGGGRLRHRWYWAGHGWSDWEDFPAPDGSQLIAIAAASHSPRHQEIYGLKGSGKVVHAWNWLHNDGRPDWESWSDWSDWHFMPDVT